MYYYMPIYLAYDSKGSFIQWGFNGKKYYFKNDRERLNAYKNALKQSKAVHANKKK
jgi:hypothetical protein